jgi:hypothetical protein
MTARATGTAGSAAEGRAACEWTKDAQQMIAEFLFQRIQLATGLENSQKINLEFRHCLHPGARQFTPSACDDRDLRLRGRQISGQDRSGIGFMSRFQGFIGPLGLRVSEISDQSGQLRFLIRGERWGVRFRNRPFQKAQGVMLGPLLRQGHDDAARHCANQDHRDGY